MLRSDDVDKGAKRTEHDNRFDRQLRLWGSHGQKLLESAHICALGSGAAVSETLKNLVLPNIHKFTIIDDATVSEVDDGNNFFVSEDDIGKPRGEVVRKNLLEMNPWDEKNRIGVQGIFINKNPGKAVEEGLEKFKKYQVVIATEISEHNMLKLSTFCYEQNITFLLMRINGLIGYIRWSKREHCIAESHPVDIDTSDIRLYPDQLKNFPEYAEYISSFDFKQIRSDSHLHRHAPWPAIVHYQLQEWIKKHGAIPKDFDERQEFKEQIKKASLFIHEELNFQEAVRNAHKACIKPMLDESVQTVLEDPAAKNITSSSDPFWFVIYAINEFKRVEGRGYLPVSAEIPDMTSLPEMYVKLQNIFRTRERKDLDAVRKHVEAKLKQVGSPTNSISAEYIDRVAKHIRTAAVVRCSSIEASYDAKRADSEALNEIFEEWEEEKEWDEETMGPRPIQPKNIHWYFAMRASDRFRTKYGRYPGVGKDLERDVKLLTEILTGLFQEYKIRAKVEPAVCQELVRFGATEIHNTAAMLGGVASQILLKLITRQFVPFDNTFVFNGIHTSANVYEL